MHFLSINGDIETANANITEMGPYVYYPNSYLTLSARSLNKYYYIGSQKVASRVGDIPQTGFRASVTPDLQKLSDNIKQEATQMAESLNMPPLKFADMPYSSTQEEICEESILKQIDVFAQNHEKICFRLLYENYQKALDNGTGLCNLWAEFVTHPCMQGFVEPQKNRLYWHHSDYLGSAALLTDQNAQVSNWYEYAPFGEMLLENSTYAYDNPYKFNAKELDTATGLYYYGARYYDPRTSVWLSVDPLAEKYPSFSPYNYTLNNPINLVDPDGRSPLDWVRGQNGSYFWDSRVTSQASAEKFWGKGAEHYAPNAMGYYSGDGQGYALLSDNAKWVRNGVEHTAPDMAGTEPAITKFKNWVGDNKGEITAFAQAMQITGDAATVSGLAVAAMGAPVAGVGAAPGLAVATVGSAMSTTGKVIESSVEIITSDYSNNATDNTIFDITTGFIINTVVDKLIPGPTPNIYSPNRTIIHDLNTVTREGVKEGSSKILDSQK